MANQEDYSSNAGPSGKTLHSPTGGGGEGGSYVFADLEELNAIIDKWEAVRLRIRENARTILQARDAVYPPADNAPSRIQAQVLISSLETGHQHNQAMLKYATAYIEKLKAARARYAADDQVSVDNVRKAGNA